MGILDKKAICENTIYPNYLFGQQIIIGYSGFEPLLT